MDDDQGKRRRSQDRFIRHQNVEHFKRLLALTTDQDRRDHILELIVAEKKKQRDAGDSGYVY